MVNSPYNRCHLYVSNKADDFLTIHRVTSHPTDWMITEVHVRKIKDTETGGRVTAIDSPIKFEMYKGGCGFLEKFDFTTRTPLDPIEEWHIKNETKKREEGKLFNGFTPLEDNPF